MYRSDEIAGKCLYGPGRSVGRREALLAAVLLLLGSISAANALHAGPLPGLDQRIEQSLPDWNVPGLFVSVVKDDKVILARGYGVRQAGQPETVDAQTLFSIGSTSKAFAAATVAVLVGDGLVAWDDRVKQFLPWLEVYDPAVAHQLAVRDMLSGTLGTSYADENRLRSYSTSTRDILERGQYIQPRAPFRSTFVYSNNMFIAAGQVVAAVSGRSWPEFARERLWESLGMNSTTANAEQAWASGNAASGHTGEIDQDPQPRPYSYCDEVCVPSGGVNANAHDIAQWLRFQLGDGTFEGKVLIEREAFEEMHKPQTIMRPVEDALGMYVPFPTEDLARWGVRSPAYGFGWGIFEYRGRRVLWHSGGANDTKSIAILVPGESLGVFVSANRDQTRIEYALALHIVDAYLGGNTEDWNALFLEQARRQVSRQRRGR